MSKCDFSSSCDDFTPWGTQFHLVSRSLSHLHVNTHTIHTRTIVINNFTSSEQQKRKKLRHGLSCFNTGCQVMISLEQRHSFLCCFSQPQSPSRLLSGLTRAVSNDCLQLLLGQQRHPPVRVLQAYLLSLIGSQ